MFEPWKLPPPPDPIPGPPPWTPPTPGNTLGEKITNTLAHAFHNVSWYVVQFFNLLVNRVAVGLTAAVNTWLLTATTGLILMASGMFGPTSAMLGAMRGVAGVAALPRFLSVFTLLAMFIGGVMGQIFVGPIRLVVMQVMRQVQPARASVSQTAGARAAGFITPQAYESDMLDMGFTPDRQAWLLETMRQWPYISFSQVMANLGLLSEEDAANLLHRGGFSEEVSKLLIDSRRQIPQTQYVQELVNRHIIDESEGEELLRNQGYMRDDPKKILDLRFFIPPVQDLIRFAVREVYSPALAESLGLFQEFDQIWPQMQKWAESRGLTQEQARNYWGAHWDLPSVTQVFDMFHRGFISDDEMKTFLRVADFSPAWRDLLVRIAYRPPTRVDLRRMLAAGVMTEEEVYRGYLDLGNSPENARRLTDFARKLAQGANKDLARSDIEDMYSRGAIGQVEAEDSLIEMGYDEDEAAFIIQRINLKKMQATLTRRESTLRPRYVAGLVGPEDVTRILSEAGATADEINELLTLWTEQKEAKADRPSVSQLSGFYKRRIITGVDLRNELSSSGLDDRYVNWYIADIEADIADENQKRTEAELRKQLSLIRLPTKRDLLDWLNADIINQDQLRGSLQNQGYSNEDIDRYLTQAGIIVPVLLYRSDAGKVRLATLKLDLRNEFITIVQFRAGLIALQVPIDLADALVDYELAKAPPPPAPQLV